MTTVTTTATPAATPVSRPRSGKLLRPRSWPTVRVAQVVLLVAVLAAWQLAADAGWVSKANFGSPSQVWTGMASYYESGALMSDLLSTLTASLLALAIGVPLGILAGLVLAAFPFVDQVINSFLVPLNSIPRIALAPVFILWFGISMQAKVALAVSIVFFIMLFNARSGIKNVEPDMMRVSELLCVPNRLIFLKVVLPSSVPAIFAGVRLAVTYALLGVIASEMIAARNGLGTAIVKFSSLYEIGTVFAILLLLALIGGALGVALDRFESWLLRWQ